MKQIKRAIIKVYNVFKFAMEEWTQNFEERQEILH
jgi:hypothetical protein